MDELTQQLHEQERTLCPDGRDLVPEVDGNYPIETLIRALRHRRLTVVFDRLRRLLPVRRTVGYLLGTGDHYVVILYRAGVWALVDDGRVVDTDRKSPHNFPGDVFPKDIPGWNETHADGAQGDSTHLRSYRVFSQTVCR